MMGSTGGGEEEGIDEVVFAIENRRVVSVENRISNNRIVAVEDQGRLAVDDFITTTRQDLISFCRGS
jgi:hypothetical protein